MAKKYKLYECLFDSLPKRKRAVYSHYENGRMLILYPYKKLSNEWKLLNDEDIKNLSEHERQWYIRSRNEINAEYLRSTEGDNNLKEYFSELLKRYENNLKQLQKSNAEERNAGN